MIVDDLRAASEGFRKLSAGAQVIRVPWEVCPLQKQPEGRYGPVWRGFDTKLVPQKRDAESGRDVIDTTWWRPPFPTMVICNDVLERGCLFVWTDETLYKALASQGTGLIARRAAAWFAQVALIGMNPQGIPICLGATQVYAVDNGLIEDPSVRAQLTVVFQRLIETPQTATLDYDKLEAQLRTFWAEKPGPHAIDFDHILASFATACALMCCKNIQTEKVHQDRKLQAARVRRGKLPLVSWHVLKIKTGGSSRGIDSTSTSASSSEPLALHWVRGHFKTYTQEKPLLGRVVGTFWWSPHLAGKAERVVLKDYALQEEKTT